MHGSWNAGLADCNLIGRSPTQPLSLDDVCTLIGAYYDMHNKLPGSANRHRHSIPPVPSLKAVLRVTGATSWITAMQSIALLLGIDSGPYASIDLHHPITVDEARKMWGVGLSTCWRLLRENGRIRRVKVCKPAGGFVTYYEKGDVEQFRPVLIGNRLAFEPDSMAAD